MEVSTILIGRAGEVPPPTVLPIDQLVPSANNPRRSNRPAADDELLESIRTRGIITPLLVRCIEHDEQDTYEIVAGHRRFAAAVELGLNFVPVTIRDLSDEAAAQVAIVENLHRDDIAPLDEAEAYDRLLLHPGVTVTEVAAQVGKSPAYVGRRLKLLRCIPALRDALREGRLDVARAELLAKLTPELQAKAMGEDDAAVWNDFFVQDNPDGDRDAPVDTEAPGPLRWQIAENLTPLAELREWVKRHTALDLRDLATDAETRELFPDAAELMDSQTAEYKAQGADCTFAPLLEVALDAFGLSPRKEDIPAEVLVLGKDFRQVTGKPCAFAAKAVVVYGDICGEVVTVCRAKKTCAVHWPPKEKKPVGAKAAGSAAAPRKTWQEEETERRRQRVIFDRVRPDLVKVIVAATAKVQTTDKLLMNAFETQFYGDTAKAVRNVVGAITAKTFGRAWQLGQALSFTYSEHQVATALKTSGAKFDLPAAMKAAEAALKAETDATVKAPGLAKQNADRARAKAPISSTALTNGKPAPAAKKPAAKPPATKPAPKAKKAGKARAA